MSDKRVNPCPFCGYDDVEIGEPEPGHIAIDCPECQCIGPFGDTIDAAIEKWNQPGEKLTRIAQHDSLMTEQCIARERQIEDLRAAIETAGAI